jgi:organic hydroperoxide reductase OsmC/OhrA
VSEHKVKLDWQRSSEDFSLKNYNRSHQWDFGFGRTLPASAAVEYQGDEDHVDPEQAFTAALASCHMLTFLAVASQKGYVIDAYKDEACGVLAKNAAGKMAITEVLMYPKIQFSGANVPSIDEVNKLHALAHQYCFLANSVTAEVKVVETELVA